MANPRAEYLIRRAQENGANPLDIATLMQYESGLDPNNWGGTNNNYYGLIQFGPSERKQFGINTEQPSFENQVDGAFAFLKARGYKPGMGFEQMYSTILAGSPGHLDRSDGNGTVSQHVSSDRMQQSRQLAAKFLGGDYSPAMSSTTPKTTPAPMNGLLGGSGSTASDTPDVTEAQKLAALIKSLPGGSSASTPRISMPAAQEYEEAPMVEHLSPLIHRPKAMKLTGLL